MIVRDLYRYRGENGTIDTLVKLPMECELLKRLQAEEGCLLTDGVTTAEVIDIPAEDLDKWSEIPAPDMETTGE